MKLFILNKKKFDLLSDDPKFLKTIHQRAFNYLKNSIDAYKAIPLFLNTDLDVDSIAVFEFVSVDKKKDVYFYEFQGSAL